MKLQLDGEQEYLIAAVDAVVEHFGHEKFQFALSSKDIKVQPKKANIAGLQLADVLTYALSLRA